MAYGKSLFVSVILLFATASAGLGSDAYVLRFDTSRGATTGPCDSFYWQDELIFHNSGASAATIRLVGVSNGQVSNPQPLTLAAGATRSSLVQDPEFQTWIPDSHPLLWVAHLDIPEEVLVSSRVLVQRFLCPCIRFSGCVNTYAGLTLPLFDTLTPAGTPSYHLGSDIGGHEPLSDAFSARIDVMILNAGEVAASAVVQVRNASDDTPLDTLSLSVPPNSVIQAISNRGRSDGPFGHEAPSWERYVVVTMDQPGLSFVVSLSNEQPPFFAASASP